MSRDRVVLAPRIADPGARAALVAWAQRRGFTRFLLEEGEEASGVAEERLVRRTADGRLVLGGAHSHTVPLLEVGSAEELEHAVEIGRTHGAVAVRWMAERIIPLENLLARGHRRFEVWVVAAHLNEVPAMLGALERGADHLVIELSAPSEVDQLEALLEGGGGPIPWERVAIRRLAPAGVGDRVIVDTTSLLRPSEGMLVGSAAAFLLHVASEAEGSRYTRPRPFRVNAGAAHSYILLADGSTRYLSELEPGEAVTVAEPKGPARSVRVGRIKVERRPLVLVEVERKGRTYTLFLQDAETVRLSGAEGRIPTTRLAAGQTVYGAAFPPARHLGRAVEETIDER